MNATFVLLYFPSKEETYWQWIAAKEKTLAPYTDSIEIFRSHLLEFCKMRRVLCVDLTPALRTKALQGAKLYFPHDSHWTETGNRVVAAELNNFLIANGLSR